jgi:hypothetical protein
MPSEASSLVPWEIRRYLRARKYFSINWGEKGDVRLHSAYRITPGRPDYLQLNEASAQSEEAKQESFLVNYSAEFLNYTQIIRECMNERTMFFGLQTETEIA